MKSPGPVGRFSSRWATEQISGAIPWYRNPWRELDSLTKVLGLIAWVAVLKSVSAFEAYLKDVEAGKGETLYDPRKMITSGPGFKPQEQLK